MREKVADRNFTRRVGVIHLEPRKIRLDGFIPSEFALIDEDRQSRSCERFGCGAYEKQRVFIDGSLPAQLPNAVAPCKQNLSILDDRDSKTGDIKRFYRSANIGVSVLYRRGTKFG